jgi:hypothetical protein
LERLRAFVIPAAVLLLITTAACRAETVSFEAENDYKAGIIHTVAKNWIEVGTEQCRRGLYQQAKESFLRGRQYQQYLTAAEREQLRLALEKTEQLTETLKTLKNKSPDLLDEHSKANIEQSPADKDNKTISANGFNKRNILRSYTAAIVNDAAAKAQNYIDQGKFGKAQQIVETAEELVNKNRLYLEDACLRQYENQLKQLAERIDNERIKWLGDWQNKNAWKL